MEKGFRPIPTAEGWQLSTPSLLLYASHKAALDIFDEAGWENLQAKSSLLKDYLWVVLDEVNQLSSRQLIEFITPRKENERGCQVSMLVNQRGKEIFNRLTEHGIMADWREPDVIRIAPVPLYNTFQEIWTFGNIMKDIIN